MSTLYIYKVVSYVIESYLRQSVSQNTMVLRVKFAESLLVTVVICCYLQIGQSQPEDVATLNVLALGPYPSEFQPSWAGGPALIPAAQLAADLINNDSSILSGYRLNIIPVDSGCNHIGTLYLDVIEKLFSDCYHNDCNIQRGNTIVGIVGPGCSEATLNLAPLILKDELNLMQISIATTPEINGDDVMYSNTFRTVSSALKFVDTFQSLLNHTKWRRFAVLYDQTRRYHTELYKEFKKSYENRTHSIYSSGVEEFLLKGAFETLHNDRLRIIFVFADQEAARKILCVAYNQHKIFPTHQWIFTERGADDFKESTSVNYDKTMLSCSKEEMEKALDGVILSEFQFKREDNDTKTISNISFDVYEQKYNDSFKQHLIELDIDQSNVTTGAERYALPYFDAVWALALSLNSSLEELDERNLSLTQYNYNRSSIICNTKRVGDVIREHIKALTFEGMSGTIKYDSDSRSIVPSIGIKVTQFKLRGTIVPICLHIDNDNNSCSIGFNDAGISMIDDKFKPIVTKPPLGLGISILIVALVMLVAVALLQLLFIHHSDKRSIKASSPTLNHLIFSGNYISLVAVVSYTSKEMFVESMYQRPVHYGVLCSTIMWCNVFAITLVFGTLSAKTWRLYRIFGFFRQGRVRYASDGILILFIVLLLLTDLVYLLAWNLISPWWINDDISTSGNHLINLYTCDCDKLIYWLVPLLAYKGVLAAIVVYLSVQVRRIKRKEFDFSKHMIALIYLLLLLYAILLPMHILFITKIPLLSFLAQNILALATVYASCVFLFLPPLRLVWTKSKNQSKPLLPKSTMCCSQ